MGISNGLERLFTSEFDKQFVEILLKGLDTNLATRPTSLEMAKLTKTLIDSGNAT
jgi:hypothetical protein